MVAFGSITLALGLLALSVALAAAAAVPGADMTITKSASPSSVAADGTYTYTITVQNAGTVSATLVKMNDNSIEPDVVIDFSTLAWTPSTAGSCSWKLLGSDPNNLNCDFGTLAVGASVIVTFDVTAPAATCPRVRNTAQVSASNEPPANQTNNTAVVNVPMTGCPSGSPTPSPTSTPTVKRLFGFDRNATAVAVSKNTFPAPGVGISAVYIANGQTFPDALGGAPAAARRNAPMLLVTKNAIPAVTTSELQRLKPNTIYLLGGTGVISSTVQSQLVALARSGSVVRFAGIDRYDTAARAVANAFPTATEVMIVTGENFPDALAGGAGAAHRDIPILLVKAGSIPPQTQAQLTRLHPTKIFLVGGTGVISTAVEVALRSGGRTVIRIAGDTRYLTAIGVARTFFSTAVTHIFVATGLNFPDALAAGAVGDPILLTLPTGLPPGVGAEATRLDPSAIDVLGGPSVVSDAVLNQLRGT